MVPCSLLSTADIPYKNSSREMTVPTNPSWAGINKIHANQGETLGGPGIVETTGFLGVHRGPGQGRATPPVRTPMGAPTYAHGQV